MKEEICVFELDENNTFPMVYEILKDVVYKSTEEKVNNILKEYSENENKTLFGYFVDKKIIGIIGVEENNNNNITKISHF